MANPFDQFDAPAASAANPFDQFDAAPPPAKGGNPFDHLDAATPPSAPDDGEPGFFSTLGSAALRGAVTGGSEVAQAAHPFTDQPTEPQDQSSLGKMLAKPISEGYGDPKWWAAQIAYGAGQSAPSVALGFAGAGAGTLVAPGVGTAVGGAAGFALGSAIQTVGPAYQRARQDGLSHDDAVDRALKETGIAAVAGAAMGAVPTGMGRAIKGPISNALAHIFVAQPAIGTAQQLATGAVEGRTPSADELATGYATNVGLGAALSAAHLPFRAAHGIDPATATDRPTTAADMNQNDEAAGAAARARDATIASEPLSDTTPEPASDIHAQVRSMLDRSTTKDAVFIAPGNEDAIPSDLPDHVTKIPRDEGTLLTTNDDKAEAYRTAPAITDDSLAETLGYPETKAQAIASGDPRMVQARDPDGNVVAEAVSSPARMSETAAELLRQAPEGSTIHLPSGDEMQARRASMQPDDTAAAGVIASHMPTSQETRQNGIMARSLLGKIFSPSTVSDTAERQAALQREGLGLARRETQQARAGLEQFRETAPQLGTPEGDALMAYMEGRSDGAQLQHPEQRQLANYVRSLNKGRQQALADLPAYQARNFIEDYFPHMWEDPRNAAQVMSTAGVGSRQGSGRNLKARSIPTYADGIAAGLKPLHTNIVDGEMAYLSNIDRFIAHQRIFDQMQKNGTAYYAAPGRQRAGDVPLNGRLGQKTTPDGIPLQAYAQEDAARVYNNMISRGIMGTDAGPLYDRLLRAKNGMTQAELSFSAFHAITMAMESTVSEFARGFLDLAAGHPLSGLAKMATSPAAMAKYYRLGRQGAAEYVKPSTQGAAIARQMNLLTRAGIAPPIGRGEQQYFTAQRGAYRSFRDFRQAMGDAAKDMRDSPLAGPFRQFAQQTARVMDTVSAPLFDHLIPRIKAGASLARMSDWMQQHPLGGHDEMMKAARDIVDSTDNRFGEFNYDNLMWHTGLKQAAFMSMRAFGWAIGTWREIGGGVADLARARLTERAAYVVGLGAVTAFANGMMTYLHTGKQPSMQDLYAYDTGQKDDRGNPIRAMIPGYAKEFSQLGANIYARGAEAAGKSYLYSKAASMWTSAYELLTNRDFRDDPIGPPQAGMTTAQGREQMPEFLSRYFKEAASHYVPINWRSAIGVQSANDVQGLTAPERALAIRKAPFALSNPEAARQFFQHQEEHPKGPDAKWRAKLKREAGAAEPPN